MTREERDNALKVLKNYDLNFHKINGMLFSAEEIANAFDMAIKALEQEPCEDAISRKSIKQKLQEHHDFFVNAYGGFSNLPLSDKSRVDEITNCIAMVVNEPPVTPQEPLTVSIAEIKFDEDKLKELANKAVLTVTQQETRSPWEHDHEILKAYSDGASEALDIIRSEIEKAVWEDVVVSLDGTDEVRIPRLDPDDVFEIIDKYRAESEDKE